MSMYDQRNHIPKIIMCIMVVATLDPANRPAILPQDFICFSEFHFLTPL